MVKGIYRTPVQEMKITDTQKFVTPDNLKGKLQNKSVHKAPEIILSHLGKTLAVKFDRIMHGIFSGEWINNNTFKKKLTHELTIITTKGLAAKRCNNPEELDKRLETREWISQSVSQMRGYCNRLLKENIGNKEVTEVLELLSNLDDVNQKESEKEIVLFKNKIENKRTGLEIGKRVKGEVEDIGEGKEIEGEVKYKEAGEGKKALWKIVAEKLREFKEIKSIDNSPISKEDRKRLGEKVTGLIEAAERIKEKDNILVHTSLGANWGSMSTENKALQRIKEEGKNAFSDQKNQPQVIRSKVVEVISLIHKAFTQDIYLVGDDLLKREDTIPAPGVPENIQNFMDELKELI